MSHSRDIIKQYPILLIQCRQCGRAYYMLQAAKQEVVAVYKLHDVITDVTRPGTTLREDHSDTQQRRTLC